MNSLHQNTVQLLPWYVNGTLNEHEMHEVERHLSECLSCRAALREQKRLHTLVRNNDDIPLSSEHGVRDLLSRIDRIEDRSKPIRIRRRFLGFAVTAACLAIFLVVVLLPPQDAGYVTLTDPAEGGTRIDIVFAAGVDSAEIAEIVRSLGGQVNSGPSELGRYSVSLDVNDESEVDDIVDVLAADPRVVFVGRNYMQEDLEDEP